ncbi:TPA: DUF262 domain-containing protein [Yersinia enterocolitica]|nr:DUF262 domain-containing protein [Yersinia enterocolitica]
MKIEANDKDVQDIFSLGYFQIPRFQRPYSWEREEVENFWDDVIKNNPENYFIGSMVVYQSKKPYFGIVDGQQRLTTITIILSAIRDSFIKLGQENLAKGIHKYIEKANVDNENEFILNSETSFPFLQGVVQSFKKDDISCDVGMEEKNLKNAFEFIFIKLLELIPEINEPNLTQPDMFPSGIDDPIQKLKDIRDKVLALKLVFIQLDNEEDAYLIFETLNARGRDLKTSDLVKNLFLKKLKSTNNRFDSAKEIWNKLVSMFDNNFGEQIIDAYLLHFWISEYNYTTEKKLFSEVKTYLGDDGDKSLQLLQTLVNVAQYYQMMLNPNNTSWGKEERVVRDSLIALNSFKVKQQSSMVLALLRSWKNGKLKLRGLKTALIKIEYFHFVFNAITSQRSSGMISTIYSEHAIRLTKSSNTDEIQSVLNSLFRSLNKKLPSYEEFHVNFIELNYISNKTRSKNIIKYALSKQLGDAINCLNIDHDFLTLEHYISESELKNGEKESVVGSIGNLLLIDDKTNNSILNNLDVKEKYNVLSELIYPLEKTFITEAEWDEVKVKERTSRIAHVLYNSVSLD